MDRFDGKRVLITGGSQGIGKACAIRFADEGAEVSITYSSNEQAAEETKHIIHSRDGQCAAVKVDLGDPEKMAEVWDRFIQGAGGFDIIVLNAAHQKKATFDETDLDLMRRTFDVNVFGNFHLASLFIRERREEGKPGVIVVHSSNQAEFVNPTGFAYSLTKAALNHMVRHIALACAKDDIRVNGVVLGWFDTEGERRFYSKEQIEREAKANLPMERAGRPEEAAAFTAFLASDESSYMTGSLLRCDGGFALAPDLGT